MSFDPESFSGKARLFPLPNLVLFPHVLLPLHIFEPRYRELLEDALQGDRLIAMSVLRPGFESQYEGRPPVYPVACLGRVATFQLLDNGKYNVLLVGLRRVGLVRELAPDRQFREAEVELLEDNYPQSAGAARHLLQKRLIREFKRCLPDMPSSMKQVEDFLSTDVTLGMLTDLVAYTLQLDIGNKVQLLSESNVDRRAARLVELLAELEDGSGARRVSQGKFPPDFSLN